MKKLFIVLILMIVGFSCDIISPQIENNSNVFTLSFDAGSTQASTLGSVDALYEIIINNSSQSRVYKNYEVITSSYTLNWNSEKKVLFMNYSSDGSCNWQHIYENVTEEKLNDFNFEDKVGDDVIKSIKSQFDKNFLEVKNEDSFIDLKNKFINTNLKCRK